jgi:hypothetical protein
MDTSEKKGMDEKMAAALWNCEHVSADVSAVFIIRNI